MILDPNVELFAVGLMLALLLFIGAVVIASRLPRGIKAILVLALLLRLVGTYARTLIVGDAIQYYLWGLDLSQLFMAGDFSIFLDSSQWIRGGWHGTNFIRYPVALIMTVIGPSYYGTFMAFAAIAYFGVLAFATAFRKAYPTVDYAPYWTWVFLLPSIWFWPSSIGKEAIMMLGLGITTLGLVGNGRRLNVFILLIGLCLVYAVRPQVAAVAILAIVLSFWIRSGRWDAKRVFQGLAILMVGFFLINSAIQADIDATGLEGGIEEYIVHNMDKSSQGGSAIEQTGLTVTGIPMSVVNTLMRPFPWEARNAESAFAALEVAFIWLLIYFRRRTIVFVLRMWRSDRLLRFAVPFLIAYVIALGVNIANLGIIARQRVLIFPFLFLIVEAGAHFRRQHGVRSSGEKRRSIFRGSVRRPPGSMERRSEFAA